MGGRGAQYGGASAQAWSPAWQPLSDLGRPFPLSGPESTQVTSSGPRTWGRRLRVCKAFTQVRNLRPVLSGWGALRESLCTPEKWLSGFFCLFLSLHDLTSVKM